MPISHNKQSLKLAQQVKSADQFLNPHNWQREDWAGAPVMSAPEEQDAGDKSCGRAGRWGGQSSGSLVPRGCGAGEARSVGRQRAGRARGWEEQQRTASGLCGLSCGGQGWGGFAGKGRPGRWSPGTWTRGTGGHTSISSQGIGGSSPRDAPYAG